MSLPTHGDNGRAHRIPPNVPRLAKSAGGLILPEADAMRRAQEEAAKWETKCLAWCPTVGAFEIPMGTECERRPHPLNGQIPTIWAPCPTCSEGGETVYHFANVVMCPVVPVAPDGPDEEEPPRPA